MSIRALIALAGRAGAGKDTAAELLHEPIWASYQDDGIHVTGFARRVKAGCKAIFGLDFETMTREEKEAPIDRFGGRSPRQLMQLLGTEFGRSIHPDLWVMMMESTLYDHPTRHPEVVLITDVRFPNELAWVRRKGGAVWWIERTGIAPVAAHSSETSISAADCDRTIPNFGTRDDLQAELERAWSQWLVQREVA